MCTCMFVLCQCTMNLLAYKLKLLTRFKLLSVSRQYYPITNSMAFCVCTYSFLLLSSFRHIFLPFLPVFLLQVVLQIIGLAFWEGQSTLLVLHSCVHLSCCHSKREHSEKNHSQRGGKSHTRLNKKGKAWQRITNKMHTHACLDIRTHMEAKPMNGCIVWANCRDKQLFLGDFSSFSECLWLITFQ